ncbi:MAG: hypothetical protein IT357_07365 [Gemmatimonadaceae bacterium]|nr:hypothetical protein [Gemmatimonadaceae bacterium]
MADHLAFGLRLRSAHPLPGLAEVGAQGDADVVIALDAQPPWAEVPEQERYRSDEREGDEPAVVVSALPTVGAIVLRYAEGIRFHITTDGRQVWADWDAPLTLADAMTFLVGPVLGYALRRRGLLALHASAAVIDGRAVAFVGPGGAGKSTLVTACAQRGYAVVTDDILVLRETPRGWMTTPAPDQVRLWEDSERLLFGAGSRLAPLTPTFPKRGLSLAQAGLVSAHEAVPVGALLLFAPRESIDAPRIEAVGGGEALLGLVSNSYANYLLDDAERGAELQAVGRLAAVVPVKRLVPHEDPGRLDALVQTVSHFVMHIDGRD